MELNFLAKGIAPERYVIDGDVINGIDTSLFTEDATFTGSEATQESGIYGMTWIDGVLHVTLGQMTKGYLLPVASHDWREGDWLDAADYDPAACYVKATNPQAVALLNNGQAEYFQDDDGRWSVRMIETAEQEPAE